MLHCSKYVRFFSAFTASIFYGRTKNREILPFELLVFSCVAVFLYSLFACCGVWRVRGRTVRCHLSDTRALSSVSSGRDQHLPMFPLLTNCQEYNHILQGCERIVSLLPISRPSAHHHSVIAPLSLCAKNLQFPLLLLHLNNVDFCCFGLNMILVQQCVPEMSITRSPQYMCKSLVVTT